MTWTIEVVRTSEELAALAPVWNDVAERAAVTHPFVTHAWMQTWWESFGDGAELMVLVVRRDGEPVAIAPLCRGTERICGARHRAVRLMANEHSPRCDFLVAAGAEDAYAEICSFLINENAGWDVLQMCDVPAESPTVRAMVRHASENGFLAGVRRGPDSPVLRTTATWNDYFATLPSKRRWFLRNRLKRLSALGRVSLETIEGGAELHGALEDGFRLEAAAWKGDAGTAIVCAPDVRRFYTSLAERAAARGWLRLHFLKLDEQRIAFAYCLEYDRRMFLLKPGFDPEYADFSPGSLLFYLALQELHASDVVAYDFLGWGDHWKLQWTTESVGHDTLFLYARRPLTRIDHYTRFALMPRLRRARNLLHVRR